MLPVSSASVATAKVSRTPKLQVLEQKTAKPSKTEHSKGLLTVTANFLILLLLANFDALVALANSYEKTRRKYNHSLTELFLLKHKNEQLCEKLQVVNHQIGSVLKALTKKTSEYNMLKDVKEKMFDKLRTIQSVVNKKKVFKKPNLNFENANKNLYRKKIIWNKGQTRLKAL